MIFQLIYTCALTANVDCDDLKTIAEESRSRNLKSDITGILLCKDGSVLQVLEGERSSVRALYERIVEDVRVKNPLVLLQRMSTEREFPNWSMGYRDANASDCEFNLTGKTLAEIISTNISPEITTISRTFARVNGLN